MVFLEHWMTQGACARWHVANPPLRRHTGPNCGRYSRPQPYMRRPVVDLLTAADIPKPEQHAKTPIASIDV